MIINVTRYGFGLDSTGGLLFVDGRHIGYTCEDQRRSGPKVMHETCIPQGRYELKLRDEGGMNEKYKRKYSFHRGMLHLQDVPGFTFIYFHVGNTDDNTSGCILVGGSSIFTEDEEYAVARSSRKYRELYNLIYAAMKNDEDVFVEVS